LVCEGHAALFEGGLARGVFLFFGFVGGGGRVGVDVGGFVGGGC